MIAPRIDPTALRHRGILRHRTILLFVPGMLCLLAARPAAAQQEMLARLAPLARGVWVAEGVATGVGRFTATRRHEWTLDGRFLRIRQELVVESGPAVEEDMLIGWDPAAGRLRLWSFASDGSWAEAVEELGAGDNRFVFLGRTSGGVASEWRTTSLIIDDASFSVLVELRTGRNQYEHVMTMAFSRRGS